MSFTRQKIKEFMEDLYTLIGAVPQNVKKRSKKTFQSQSGVFLLAVGQSRENVYAVTVQAAEEHYLQKHISHK